MDMQELILHLRAAPSWVDGASGGLLRQAADALEAKAAPVGELSWQPAGADYDHSIHTNPDAKAWADLFVATFPGLVDKHELMITWFANAMMAMHDHLKSQQPQSAEAVVLSVWYGPMPESNGKQNYTALLHRKGESLFDGAVITLDRSEYPDRVRYEADRVRYLIGELAEEPRITDYDADAHSGYVAPPTTPQPSAGVVMPTLVVKESGEWGDSYERGFKAALREFARLNGKEVV